MNRKKPNRKTVRAAIRGSVPEGKLRNAKIVLSDADYGSQTIAGFTEYDKGKGASVVKIGAPASDDAIGITIRGHETRHATKHKAVRRKKMTPQEAIASQIVDDVNVETMPLPNVRELKPYRRAHLAVALNDLRTLLKHGRNMKSGAEPDTAAQRNAQIVHAVRIEAMLMHYGACAGHSEVRARINAQRRLANVIGTNTRRAIREVIRMAKSSRMRNRAISTLVALLEREESPEEEEDREEGTRHEPFELLMPVSDGTATEGKMTVTDLRPKSVFCSKDRTITRRFTPDGVNINTGRYVNAIVSGESHGLFMRRVRQKAGGVVLIDASGSMSANTQNLAALCALIPTATVAYYSGTVQGHGELVVFAYEGKRFAGSLPEETLHGNNSVDLQAIQWMMKLPKPHYLVSDLEFCGGVIGSETIAHALVERAESRGDLTVHRSLDAAFEAFGGKGNLPS